MNCFTNLWTVKLGDWERGMIVAVLTAPLTIIYESVSNGSLTINWQTVAATAIAGGIAYILKNLVTGSSGKILSNKP